MDHFFPLSLYSLSRAHRLFFFFSPLLLYSRRGTVLFVSGVVVFGVVGSAGPDLPIFLGGHYHLFSSNITSRPLRGTDAEGSEFLPMFLSPPTFTTPPATPSIMSSSSSSSSADLTMTLTYS